MSLWQDAGINVVRGHSVEGQCIWAKTGVNTSRVWPWDAFNEIGAWVI